MHLAIEQVPERLQQLHILREGRGNICTKESLALVKKRNIFRLYIPIICDVWNVFQQV